MCRPLDGTKHGQSGSDFEAHRKLIYQEQIRKVRAPIGALIFSCY